MLAMFSKNTRRAILAGFCMLLVSMAYSLSAGGRGTPAVIGTLTPTRILEASDTLTLAASECQQPLSEETLGLLESRWARCRWIERSLVPIPP